MISSFGVSSVYYLHLDLTPPRKVGRRGSFWLFYMSVVSMDTAVGILAPLTQVPVFFVTYNLQNVCHHAALAFMNVKH